MPTENHHNTEPPGLFGYYGREVLNFHLSGNQHDATTRTGRAAEQAHHASQTTTGAVIAGAGTALGLFGEVMSFTHQMSEAAMIPLLAQLSSLQGIACLPAASHLDPVLGIDMHMVRIPPSPLPIPMPHPYIAMIMDPKDWLSVTVMTIAAMAAPTPTGDGDADAAAALAFAVGTMALGMAGLGATIKLGMMTPRAVSGVENKCIPHFPMGAGFYTPWFVDKNSGQVQFGSLFVSGDGEPFAGLMHMNNDCWDIGLPALSRLSNRRCHRTGTTRTYLYMPTGFIMAIPSHNVLVNPVPTPINPMAPLRNFFNAAFGKLLQRVVRRAFRNFPGLRNALSRAICFVTGHPVDVVSGRLFTDEEDFSLPGVIPLVWERVWYSDSDYRSPLGHGWHHSYDMALSIDSESMGAMFRMGDGRVIEFELPKRGKSTFNRNEKLQLHQHADGCYYITDANRLIYKFTATVYHDEITGSAYQRLHTISNTNGYAIRFEYTRRGGLSKIFDSAERVLSIQNDAEGRIVSVRAPHPDIEGETFVIARYEYNDEGDMVCHTNAIEGRMRFEYQHHLLVKEIWRDGQEWNFRYDGKTTGSRCIHTWGKENLYNHKLTYQEGVTVVENSLGYFTAYHHKGGLVCLKIDGNGAAWKYRYNDYNELEWETDPLGNQTAFTHDEWGNTVSHTDAAGGFTYAEYYHPLFPHLPTETMNAAGGKWKWTYDEQGNLVERTDPLGGVTCYDYTNGLLASVLSSSAAVTTLKYDKQQNLIEVTTADEAVTKYGYDLMGRCTGVINPYEAVQKRKYNLNGDITGMYDFDTNTIMLEYDGIGNVIRYKDQQKDIQYTYRGLWKLTSRTEGGASIHFSYNTEEQLRTVVNQHGLPYRFELDAVGNVTKEIGFDEITRQYDRNAVGWVTQVSRPAGKYTKYSYDPVGRVTEVLYSDGKTEQYTYRTDGSLITAINETAVVKFQRDVMGKVIKEVVNGDWVASEFDIAGNKTRTKSSLGVNICYQHNMMGDVTQIEANGWLANFEYDKLGLEVSRHIPGGVSVTWKRDGIGRPLIHTVGLLTNRLERRGKKYVWDVNDRLHEINDNGSTTKFEYDICGNLVKTVFADGEVQWRNPDAVGNLFKTEIRNDRTYKRGGQLKETNMWEYQYDAEGNLIKKLGRASFNEHSQEVWFYQWNDAGRLTEVIRPDGAGVKFGYDALGRRVWKKYQNVIKKFAWDGNVPLHEWTEFILISEKLSDIEVNENDITTWIFDLSGFAPAAKILKKDQYSIVPDHLGTPSKMYTNEGKEIQNYELDSYGKLRTGKNEAANCPFRYQGQYEDIETGLSYNRFRYYSSEECMYISQDPIGMFGGLRLYGYVTDPNIYVDVFGLTYSSRTKKEALRRAGVIRGRIARGIITQPRTKTSAVVSSRTGNPYYGNSGVQPTNIHPTLRNQMPRESLENWSVNNCAEFDAVNNALNAGENIDDLHVYTVGTHTEEVEPMCLNCQESIRGAHVHSG